MCSAQTRSCCCMASSRCWALGAAWNQTRAEGQTGHCQPGHRAPEPVMANTHVEQLFPRFIYWVSSWPQIPACARPTLKSYPRALLLLYTSSQSTPGWRLRCNSSSNTATCVACAHRAAPRCKARPRWVVTARSAIADAAGDAAAVSGSARGCMWLLRDSAASYSG